MNLRRKRFYLAAGGLTLGALILRLFRFDYALEYDEIWTLKNYAVASLTEIFTNLSLPNNHPLNSLFVKLISQTGAPPQWIRLAPLIAGVLSVPLAGIASFALWRRRNTALWAMFFLAVLPGAVFYSQQARGYSLQLCLLLVYIVGLVTVRKRPVAGACAIVFGSIGSLLTVPTSAFYLGAIGCVYVYHCRQEWKKHQAGIAALVCGGLICLIWVLLNLDQFVANQSWGITIGSPAAFFDFFTMQMLSGVPFYFYPLMLAALILGFRRVFPVLWIWGCLIAAALCFNGGPERTYLPLMAATALGAAYGCTLLQRRFPRFRKAILFIFAAAGICWITAAYLKPYPDWYALHDAIRELPEEITVVLPANDTHPLAWNNLPDAYYEQTRRISPLPRGRSRSLLILNRDARQTLNGAAADGGEREFPLDVQGTPMRLDAMNGYLYGLEELKTAPNPGDTVIAFIRPLPEADATELFSMFLKNESSLALNLWLCVPLASERGTLRYYLLGAKIEDPGVMNWERFRYRHPGATSVYRLVPPGKKE